MSTEIAGIDVNGIVHRLWLKLLMLAEFKSKSALRAPEILLNVMVRVKNNNLATGLSFQHLDHPLMDL